MPRLRANSKLQVVEGLPWEQQYVMLNAMLEPTKDRRVREALSRLWDPKEYVDLMGGTALASEGPVPATLIGATGSQVAYQYDPARAKALLREAGVKPGTPLVLMYNRATSPSGSRSSSSRRSSRRRGSPRASTSTRGRRSSSS